MDKGKNLSLDKLGIEPKASRKAVMNAKQARLPLRYMP
jgi:hypothetical protein